MFLRRLYAVLLVPVWLLVLIFGWTWGHEYIDAPLTLRSIGMAFVWFIATTLVLYLLGGYISDQWRGRDD